MTRDKVFTLPRSLIRQYKIRPLIKELNLESGRSSPVFCIAGNCQVFPLKQWIRYSFPFSKIYVLTPYHLIQRQAEIDLWVDRAQSADFVMMIPVAESFRGFNFGSESVRHLLHDNVRFISYPSFHLEIFYPFFGTLKSPHGNTLRGSEISALGHNYGDYHDFLAIALSRRNTHCHVKFIDKIVEIHQANSFSSSVIEKIAITSFREFKSRYPDFIDIIRADIGNAIAHTYNHPAGRVLNRIYEIIWKNHIDPSGACFRSFVGDPFRVVRLPIPSFVSKAILCSTSQDIPWDGNHEYAKNLVPEPIHEYVHNTVSSIAFYQSNPDILLDNASHRKLHSANEFLAELGV